MIAIPAIDVREGACVQLVGGRYEEERVRLADPVAVADAFLEAGLRTLHVVDLDAATGRGGQHAAIAALLARSAAVQVGGGIRTGADVDGWFAAGAARVVLGTRALEDSVWLGREARRHPGRCIVAVDVREREVATHGWTRTLPRPLGVVLGELAHLPLGGVLVTAVHREGRLGGPDLALVEEVVAAVPHRVLAAGGIATMDDLAALARLGAAGAVVGMALYTGALEPRAVAKEFGA